MSRRFRSLLSAAGCGAAVVADVARPIIFHGKQATCWHPHVKGFVQHENSIYNNWRFDQLWLDK